MAIPTLAAMAALTLLHNPHVLSEDDALDFGDFDAYASKLQAAIRGYLSRANNLLGKLKIFPVRSGGTRPFRMGTDSVTRMYGNAFVTG